MIHAANGPDSLVWWSWVGEHAGEILWRLGEHIRLTALAVAIGLIIAVPLALTVRPYPRLRAVILAGAGILYTIPSIALLFVLGPITGFTSLLTVLIALVTYTLLILLRNILTGLDQVPPEAVEAARGMGLTDRQVLTQVEVPLAVPSIMAGLRTATVTTIGLVTIAALLAQGGLGRLIVDGINRAFSTPLVVGSVLSIALAVGADLLLLRAERAVSPWATGAAGRG